MSAVPAGVLPGVTESAAPPLFERWTPPPGHPLAPHVDYAWWSVERLRPPQPVRVLPDGRVEVIWSDGWFGAGGHVTMPVLLDPDVPRLLCGVQLKLGHAAAVLGTAARDLVGLPPALEELWGRDGRLLDEQMHDACSGRARIRLLLDALARRAGRAPTDAAFDAAVRALCAPDARVADVGAAVGLSERQLRRRFDRDVGFGPKMLQRLERFQRFVGATGAGDDLGRAAAEAGYADQSHLVRESRSFAGVTPATLVAERVITGRRRLPDAA